MARWPGGVLAVPVATGMIGGMGQTGLRPWRDGWAGQLLGRPCVLCDLIGVRENSWGIRVFAGRYVDAYLPRSGSVPGYTIAVWNGRHVSEPTQLEPEEAAATGRRRSGSGGRWSRASSTPR